MDILKFALGVRFDLIKDDVTEEDVDYVLGQVSSVLSAEETAGLHLYGGKTRLSDLDGEGIYTLVFMNGKMKGLREVYLRLEGDAIIKSLLERRIPFIQNNTIRAFKDMELLGTVGEDGTLSGGSAAGIVFRGPDPGRLPSADGSSILIAPSAFAGSGSAEASVKLARVFRKAFPGKEIVRIPIPCSDDFLSSVEIATGAERHGMNVTSLYGGKIYADYLAAYHTTAVIVSPGASGADNPGSDPDTPSTSYGLGKLLRRAVHEGLKEIYVIVNGSEAKDNGFGAAKALGCRYALDGNEISSFDEYDARAKLDVSAADPLLKKARIYICDLRSGDDLPDSLELLYEAIGALRIDPLQAFFRIVRFEEKLGNACALVTGGAGKGPVIAAGSAEGKTPAAFISDSREKAYSGNAAVVETVSDSSDLEDAAERVAAKLSDLV